VVRTAGVVHVWQIPCTFLQGMQYTSVRSAVLSSACSATVLSMTSLAERVHFHNKSSSLNGVDENVTTGESVVAPSANESNRASTCHIVIFRVDVEPANPLDVATSWIIGYARDVKHADTGTVVGESRETVFYVEVVVDRLYWVLVVARDLGRFEATEVPLWTCGVSSFVPRLPIPSSQRYKDACRFNSQSWRPRLQ
jgi:hypothetical protein